MPRYPRFAVFFAACCLVRLAGAQQAITYATLSGWLEDPSGGRLQRARVAIVHRDRNQTREMLSDPSGRFQFLHLPPGDYELRLNEPRFAPFVRSLRLSAGQALDLPVRLALATASHAVTVLERPLALEASRVQVSETVAPREMDSLPLNGRNYLDLALLAPGVSRTNTGAPQRFAETSAVPGAGISVAGQRNLNNTFLVDGLSANDDAAALAGTFFSQEVIREFQVITAGGAAEFGRASSGIINITTRSGTNQWHGRLYGFLRNQRLDARNPLATRKDPLTQTQYGASLGAPLRRDRTFVFTNWEQTRRQAAGFVTISAPNLAAINRGLDSGGYLGPRVSTGEFPTGYDTTNAFLRLDHQAAPRHSLAARYSFYDISSPNARSAGGLSDVSRGTRSDDTDHTLAFSHIAALSPALLTETRLQFTRSRLDAPANQAIGPAVNIAGVASFGPSTTSPVGRDNDLYELSHSVSR
ncbi:MAG: hypothetical protein FJW37_15730, partial [Acidobacteria bacterium]|nr:hypothetical protein [Acidobacteriota bacterium]